MNNSPSFPESHDAIVLLDEASNPNLNEHDTRLAVTKFSNSSRSIREKVSGLSLLISRGPDSVIRSAGIHLLRALREELGDDSYSPQTKAGYQEIAFLARQNLDPVCLVHSPSEGSLRSQYASLILCICGFSTIERCVALALSKESVISTTSIGVLHRMQTPESLGALRQLFNSGSLVAFSKYLCALYMLSADDMSVMDFLRSQLTRMPRKQSVITALELVRVGNRAGEEYLLSQLDQGIDKEEAAWWIDRINDIPPNRIASMNMVESLVSRLQNAQYLNPAV